MKNDYVLINMKNYNKSLQSRSLKMYHKISVNSSINSKNSDFVCIANFKSKDIYKSIIDKMPCIINTRLKNILSETYKKSNIIRKQFNIDAHRCLFYINNNIINSSDDVQYYLGPIASGACLNLALLFCTQSVYAPVVKVIQPPIETDMYVGELQCQNKRLFVNHLYIKKNFVVFESIKNLGITLINNFEIQQISEFSIYMRFDIPLDLDNINNLLNHNFILEISPIIRKRNQFLAYD